MSKYKSIKLSLIDPNNNVSVSNKDEIGFKTKDRSFDNFDEIPDLFLPDDGLLTNIQSDFYDDVRFPNYDNLDDFGTLIDKAPKGIFAKKLDEEIPWGCSIPLRRMRHPGLPQADSFGNDGQTRLGFTVLKAEPKGGGPFA